MERYVNKMYLIGLTGGIATGKSTISQIFIDNHIPIIDADLIARKGMILIFSFFAKLGNK